jgi:hypothetical protein
MGNAPALSHLARRSAARAGCAGVIICALALTSVLAAAQQQAKPPQAEDPGFFSTIGRWFDQGIDSFNSGARSMRERFMNFGHDASVAARTTVDNAKDAADAVGRLSGARVIIGHKRCRTAPNGAPDCIAAALVICEKQGFKSGKSVDMTTAEICPAEVYLAGRNSGPECHTETFVSRALCQ